MTDAVERYEGGGVVSRVDDALTATELLAQVTLIQNIMKAVMKENEHYGKVPGCGDKPTLLKPGAEKLAFTFRLRPEFEVEIEPISHIISGHREYRVRCRLFNIKTGDPIGEGLGSGSTMEGKWRFRTGPVELTDKRVPQDYWTLRETDPVKAKELLGGPGHTTKKGDDGKWYIAIAGEKVENDNPADLYNTVLKMAKKRAMVDAILTATAASDIFTQDIEDMPEVTGALGTGAGATRQSPPSQQGASGGSGRQSHPQGSGNAAPAYDENANKASEKQTKAIHAMLGKLGIHHEDEKHGVAAARLGISELPIDPDTGEPSFKMLTSAMASFLIKTFDAEIAADKGGGE